MTRIICVASGKGGVGKTTLVSNLASALTDFKQSVVAVDANLTTSNLGLHVGIPLYPVTLQDVLKGKARLNDAVYHHSTGFKVIPADVSLAKLMVPKAYKLVDIFSKLIGKSDFVLIDSAAGLGQEAQAAIRAADEMITITNPELPALTDALKLGGIAKKFGTKNLGVVVNRVRNKSHEMSTNEIKDFLGLPLIGHIPEDHNIGKSIANKQPLVNYNPRSKASPYFKAIAAHLIDEKYEIGIIHRLFGWLK
jgi:septum site-determining protein MinD